MDRETNDNGLHPRECGDPAAHGQAALLLVESLIHVLVARSVISTGDAIEIVDVATDVKVDVSIELGESVETRNQSLELLRRIGASLRLE